MCLRNSSNEAVPISFELSVEITQQIIELYCEISNKYLKMWRYNKNNKRVLFKY